MTARTAYRGQRTEGGAQRQPGKNGKKEKGEKEERTNSKGRKEERQNEERKACRNEGLTEGRKNGSKEGNNPTVWEG